MLTILNIVFNSLNTRERSQLKRQSTFMQQVWFLGALGLLLVYIVCRMIYRLLFHPLAGFPGPKWVAVSGLHEFYHDAIKQGQYFLEIEKMHAKYGGSSKAPRDVSYNINCCRTHRLHRTR